MGEGSNLQFVDTNILVHAHDRSAGGKHTRARELVGELWQSGQGCLSVQVLQEFYITVTQKVARPLTSDVAAQIISALSAWRVHRPGAEDILDAIQLQGRYQISFWDAMIVASARQLGCRAIWSEDLNPEQTYGTLTAKSPFLEEGRAGWRM